MRDRLRRLFLHGGHVCPWWIAYSFDNPLRRLVHPPERIFAGLVGPGDTAVDVGCGLGHFTIGLARIVGPSGKVVAVDLQEEMLARVRRRAERAGLQDRIRLHRCAPGSLGVAEQADLVVASWMVHEVEDRETFLREVAGLLKPGGRLFVAEPKGHVPAEDLARTEALAISAGLRVETRPKVALSRAVVFVK